MAGCSGRVGESAAPVAVPPVMRAITRKAHRMIQIELSTRTTRCRPDTEWKVLRMNRCACWLAATLQRWAAALPEATAVNRVDLSVHPEGLAKAMRNLPEAVPPLLARHLPQPS